MTSDTMQNPYRHSHPTLIYFERIVKRYFFLNMAFAILAAILSALFICFFSFFQQSFLMGIVLAFFFFSFVMYFILRTYVKEQKPRQFLALRNDYMKHASTQSQDPKALSEHAFAMATELDHIAPLLLTLPRPICFLEPYFKHFAAFWFWQDVHKMKELFLLAMIDELKSCIKIHPTSIEAHRDLAVGYLTLFSHYNEPLQTARKDLVSSTSIKEELQAKLRFAADSAVEECLILKEYSPKDTWVHKSLATMYKDLGLVEKEIEASEALVELNPKDYETLGNLGILYFKQGMNGKGLKIYEKLYQHDLHLAESLINHYGAYLPFDPYRVL